MASDPHLRLQNYVELKMEMYGRDGGGGGRVGVL